MISKSSPMAVQAQYPMSAIVSNCRNRVDSNMFPEQLLVHDYEYRSGNLLGGYINHGHSKVFNGTVFSEQESELTCNVSGSRKRNREETMNQVQYLPPQKLQVPPGGSCVNLPTEKIVLSNEASIELQKTTLDYHRILKSEVASTSGRSSTNVYPSIILPIDQELLPFCYQENCEIESLIRIQHEKLRLGIEGIRNRNYKALKSMIEKNVLKMLLEKEQELQNTIRRNAELEEKIKQISAENQVWFYVAKNNEAIVANLRASLEEVILQNANQNKEGFADSDLIGGLADDAQSFCHVPTERKLDNPLNLIDKNIICRSCLKNEVSILILPCRHLCLCNVCDAKHDTCPICKCIKMSSLQVLLS